LPLFDTCFRQLQKNPRVLFERPGGIQRTRYRVRTRFRYGLEIGYFIVHSLVSAFYAKALFRREKRRLPENGRKEVWIYSWLTDRCFGGSCYRDFYEGRLGPLLAEHGIPVKRMTFSRVTRRHLRQLLPWSSDFVVTPLYVALSDIV